MVTQVSCLLATLAALCALAGVSADELKIEVVHKPETCERAAKEYDAVTVHYKGALADGTVFDSSFERNEPFTFTLGAGEVIQGWDQGLLGACAGEKRKLTIPPELGYGEEGVGPIPGGATLIFDTEVVAVSDAPEPQEDAYAGYNDEHLADGDADEYPTE